MQISACMPLARCLRALRFLGVFRGWDRVLRLFFHPDHQQKAPLTFDFAGIRYPGSTGYLVDWSAFFNGAYEKPWLEYCLAHLDNPRAASVLDIGGNIGHHSLWFAAHGCTVNTFEPNPALWPEIERKSAIPGLSGGYHAASDCDGCGRRDAGIHAARRRQSGDRFIRAAAL